MYYSNDPYLYAQPPKKLIIISIKKKTNMIKIALYTHYDDRPQYSVNNISELFDFII